MADASDAARKKAEELNVELDAVEGSGKDGNVTVADVEKAAAEQVTNPDNLTEREQEQRQGTDGTPSTDGSAAEQKKEIEDEGKIPVVVSGKVPDATYSVKVNGKLKTFSKVSPQGVTEAQLTKLQKDHKYGDDPILVKHEVS